MQKTELLTWSRYDVLCWFKKATRQELIKVLQEFDFNASDEHTLSVLAENALWNKQELAIKLSEFYIHYISENYSTTVAELAYSEFSLLVYDVIKCEPLYTVTEVEKMFDIGNDLAIKLLIDCYKLTDEVTFNMIRDRIPTHRSNKNTELNLTEEKTLITTKTGFTILVTEAEISLYKSERPAEPIFTFQINNHE
jgi:hypothetical protein